MDFKKKCKLAVGDDGHFFKICEYLFIFFLKICEYIPLNTMILLHKSQIHIMHGSRDIRKMVVGDDGHFLENYAFD